MVARGHSLQALLHEYPIDLVLNLHRAATENRTAELKAQVLGMSVAITNALDLAFGGGKGKVLDHYLAALDGLGNTEADSPRRSLPRGAKAFFGGAPVVDKTR